jgi:hypothetical protein
MDERRDDLDTWLKERVQPLLPPPGTFEHITKRARRRKLNQAAIAAAGAAVVVAAAVTVPQLVLHQPSQTLSANGPSNGHPAHASTPAAGQSSAPSVNGSATPTPPAKPPVPANFAASSVTFVGLDTGWVMGQAGVPGQCTGPNPSVCTSFARTDDGGRRWYGTPAPLTGPPDGASGVSQTRFANTVSGWAFGPELWSTHDGGQAWRQVGTSGMRVTVLEVRRPRAFAVWANCTGNGQAFAANCTSFSLYSSLVGRDRWAPVRGVTGLSSGTAPGSAGLVLTGTRGYLLAPSGELYSGPITSTAGWGPVTNAGGPVTAPCAPGPAQANGQPSRAMLTATGPSGLALLCAGSPGGGSQTKSIYYSADGGKTWSLAGPAAQSGTATSLSGTPAGPVLVATTRGIEVSAGSLAGAPNVSVSWQGPTGATVRGGFSYVGMTDSAQGVAIPADTSLHAVWFTYDGGLTWQESRLG